MLKHPIKAVYLDRTSLKVSDQMITKLAELFDEWQCYHSTKSDDVIKRVKDAQIIICNKSPITKEVIANCSKLKLILVTATGTNNIDLIAAKAKGITVCNCQGYGTEAVSQHTLMLMLALAGRIMDYNQAVKEGEWQRAKSFCLMHLPIIELAGKTLGIIGYGKLGQAVAKLAKAFGLKILIGQIPNRPVSQHAISMSELLPQVDVLSLHCPLTSDTKNLITKSELYLMKKEALLINTARGGIVNEQDLADVLKNGHLGGAATDVLSTEPPTEGNPLLAPDIPRLIITPHCAWATKEAQHKIIEQIIENTKAFIKGSPIHVVN